ncbi:MAG: hypothetical protein JSU00_21975 [Acidobacteria bacterium]|nr:hypothetical protein [Acidobacteriota bacterium]
MKFLTLLLAAFPLYSAVLDLTHAVIVAPPGSIASTVLAEEVQRRRGVRWKVTDHAPAGGPTVTLAVDRTAASGRAEGYRITTGATTVRIVGADQRGVLFGVGRLLRMLDAAPGRVTLTGPVDMVTAPAYPIRGHQLGYRAQANSYDAWTVAQFEQYIRELAFFGVNSIESIPLEDKRPTPVMKVPRREMNRAVSEICKRYGLDYWAWVPADFDLKDAAKRAAMLGRIEEFLRDSPEFTGFFFPGGDPGDNPPESVLPFLEDVAARMAPLHPKAKIWLSLQGYKAAAIDAVYDYIDKRRPAWLGGLVAGPSSPPIQPARLRLPKQYGLRLYPDLTHNKICQYQVPSWDQAYALTLGREAVNPRPSEFALIHNWFAPYSDGFISYSDGIHDDVNKIVWSALAWDPSTPVRDILADYSRVYFNGAVAEQAADGLLALERNWRGPLKDNGAVESTLLFWRELERKAPELGANWRWQMCLLRANYDAMVRRRLLYETRLEEEANAAMATAPRIGSAKAMELAEAALNRAVREPAAADLKARVEELCEKLFRSIGLQSSVPTYFASGEERGAVLDFVDYPLNNRWWLEDEFKKVSAMASETERTARLVALEAWEHPGPGSFYDNVGNASKSPHVMHGDTDYVEPEEDRRLDPTFWWWDNGKSRARLSWQATLWPHSIVYEGLDPDAAYVIRTSGYGQCWLRIDGERVEPYLNGSQMGEFKEFRVEARFLKDRKLVLTFDHVTGEEDLNWRRQSRLSEVWLLRR